MSTNSSVKHTTRPNSPSPSMGIVAARLMELEPEKDRWQRVARDWYAEGVAGSPGLASCTTIWDSLATRQMARSCVVSTTSLRGDVSIYLTPGPVINQPSIVQPWTCHGLHESWQGRCRESFRIHGQPASADVGDSCYFLGSANVSRSRRCFSDISLNSKSRRKLDKYMRCNDWNIINETIRAQGLANAHI